MTTRHNTPWTPQENALMQQHYPTVGSTETARLLGRTQRAVNQQAKKLGLQTPPIINRWTSQEDDIIRKHYPTSGASGPAQYLDRTRAAINQRAQILGVTTGQKPRIVLRHAPEEEARAAIRLLGDAVKEELSRKPNPALQRGFVRALKYQSHGFFIKMARGTLTNFFAECEKIGNPQPPRRVARRRASTKPDNITP